MSEETNLSDKKVAHLSCRIGLGGRRVVVSELPLSTSAPRGEGGSKLDQFCGQTVLEMRTRGRGVSKIPKIVRTRTYLMEAPLPLSRDSARLHVLVARTLLQDDSLVKFCNPSLTNLLLKILRLRCVNTCSRLPWAFHILFTPYHATSQEKCVLQDA